MQKITCKNLPEYPADGSFYVLTPDDPAVNSFYEERTDRNIGWITKNEQQIFRNSVVGIAGCGGMGGLIAATLHRLGVGEIRIADNEVFDVSNLNRQFGASLPTIGKSKAFETARMLRSIASDTTIVVYPQGITLQSADSFTSGCDVICDEIEFWAVAARITLHRSMRRQTNGIILCAPTVGHRVYAFKFTPVSATMEETLCLQYEEAITLEHKISTGTATESEKRLVMERMLDFAAPDIPEYSLDLGIYSTKEELRKRLFDETRASIIATNPPMASGFLANQVLFHLLEKSLIKRNFVLCPSMPGYLMFDAGHMMTHIVKPETS